MDPITLFVPGLIYIAFVIGITIFWIRRRRKQLSFTDEDERLIVEMLKKAAEDKNG